MSVKIRTALLQVYAGNQEVVEVNGTTVGECLGHLIARFPQMDKMIFDESHQLSGLIVLYVNGEDADLDRPVKDGDEIHLLNLISAG